MATSSVIFEDDCMRLGSIKAGKFLTYWTAFSFLRSTFLNRIGLAGGMSFFCWLLENLIFFHHIPVQET
jgi:hypothetical protein